MPLSLLTCDRLMTVRLLLVLLLVLLLLLPLMLVTLLLKLLPLVLWVLVSAAIFRAPLPHDSRCFRMANTSASSIHSDSRQLLIRMAWGAETKRTKMANQFDDE